MSNQRKHYGFHTGRRLYLFGTTQASNMGTVKWHMSNHIFDEIRHVGSLSSLDAVLKKYAQTFFKTGYKTTYGRRNSSVDEIIKKM